MDILQKYGALLVSYCLELKKGEILYIKTTTEAEPLVREVYRHAMKAGAHVFTDFSFREQNRIFYQEADDDQLLYVSPQENYMIHHADAYLVIRAPFNLKEDHNNNQDKVKRRQKSLQDMMAVYTQRTANRLLKRCLCQYPTQGAAQLADMSLEEYQYFVFNACKLYAINPEGEWKKIHHYQKTIVDFLNGRNTIRYKNNKSDLYFETTNRIWINSDGKNNMPSGEVFTSPIEESVNGHIFFDYPSIFMGKDVRGIRLTVVDGYITDWKAEIGQDLLDSIFSIEGTRRFGEVAIGTNYDITTATKNILFDEKIGGTVHMAVGQSYLQTGGKNNSPIHWDMIMDMTDGGQIYADGQLIYENGHFLIL